MTKFALNLNRGSDLDLTATLDDDGAVIDMSGWTVEIIDVEPATLATDLTIAITEPTLGEMSLTMPWSAKWPEGKNAQVSIRWKVSGIPEALPELLVILK
ncbi:MAG: hypothetical protein ACOH2H_16255 [Cypionkella sp.]